MIELRAEMDLVCALTACSAEGSNNGTFKPIDFAVIKSPSTPRPDMAPSIGEC